MKRKNDDSVVDEVKSKKIKETQENSLNIVNPVSHIKFVKETEISVSYPGRRSFRGFNKVVERQYQEFFDNKKFEKSISMKI